MKILLINPPIRRIGAIFPLGLGYIARALVDNKQEVKVLDLNALRISQKELEKELSNLEQDAVCITGLITQYCTIKNILKTVRRLNPNIKIIIGGGIATPIPKLILEKTEADIAVIGEGEVTIVELLDTLEKSGDLSKVNGISFKENNQVKLNPPRQQIEDIDTIGFPLWDIFPVDIYLNTPSAHQNTGQISIITSRGCPYQCTFCCPSFGRKARLRSADNIIKEIKLAKEKYNIKYIHFADDLFVISKQRVYDFCKKYKEEGLNIPWCCAGRVNTVDLDLAKEMKSAGCISMMYGIESGSQRMLNNMKKGTTVEQSKNAVLATREAGINAGASFIIGTIGEDENSIRETVNFNKEAELNIDKFFFVNPIPGTELYEIAKSKGKIKDEDKYLESLGEFKENFLINLSDLPDEELIKLKKEAELEIQKTYAKNHKTNKLKKSLKNIRLIFKYYILDPKRHGGYRALFKRAVKKYIFKDPYLYKTPKDMS